MQKEDDINLKFKKYRAEEHLGTSDKVVQEVVQLPSKMARRQAFVITYRE